MQCSSCGGAVDGGERFCSHCGAPVAAAKAQFCPNCGARVDPGARFCTGCGSPQEPGAAAASLPTVAPPAPPAAAWNPPPAYPSPYPQPAPARGKQQGSTVAAVIVVTVMLVLIAIMAMVATGQLGKIGGVATSNPGAAGQGPSGQPVGSTTPTVPAAPAIDIGGSWKGTITVTSASATGLSQKDADAFRAQFDKETRDKPTPMTFSFEPSSPESGSMYVVFSATDKAGPFSYQYRGGVVTFEFTPDQKAKINLEGKVGKKDGGTVMDGSLKGSGPEKNGTVTIEGKWTMTKQ